MARRNTVQRSVGSLGKGFPSRLTFTHTYVDNFTLVSTLGSIGTQVYRLNGMYDPDYSNTGHQPMFFDQMTPLYEHYTVIASKITIWLTPSTASTVPCQVAMFQNSANGATFSSMKDIAEQYRCKMAQTTMGDTRPVKLSLGFSAKKTFGGSVLGNTDLQGTATADPAEISYGYIALKSNDNATTATFYIRAKIDFIAVWNERKVTAGS